MKRWVWLAITLLPLSVAACTATGERDPESTGEAPAMTGIPNFHAEWNYQDPAASEARFRALVDSPPEGTTEDGRLAVQTQVARALGLQKRFDEAHAVLDTIDAALTDATPVARICALLERGRAFRSSGSPEKGRPLFLEAWEWGQSNRALDDYVVDAAHMMALVEPAEAKLAWNLKAMEWAESSSVPRARNWLGALYNNIGWDYHEQKKYAEALETHRKGWEWHQARDRERGGEPSRGSLIAKWSVAKQLRCLGQLDEALVLQHELAKAWAERGEPDGFVSEEIAECLHAQGKHQEARPHFAKAAEELAKIGWVADSEPERVERLRRLGAGEGE